MGQKIVWHKLSIHLRLAANPMGPIATRSTNPLKKHPRSPRQEAPPEAHHKNANADLTLCTIFIMSELYWSVTVLHRAGSFVRIASTLRLTSCFIVAFSLTVQTKTRLPARWSRSTFGEGFLNTDDVRRVKGFHFADPDHGGVGGEHMRVVLADFFERRIVLGSYVAVVQIVIVQDDIYYFLCDAVVVSVPLDLDVEIELPVSASGKFEDFIQSGDP